ncbi:uncharacterized protein DS421_5g157940 [Arachis hypogaea]|nr:uncharacterized protein DS421_5g157940 [Arachis hypogaea]
MKYSPNNKKEKQTHKTEKGETYFVEPASDNEEKDSEANNQKSRDMASWEEVLSRGFKKNLKIKRERDNTIPMRLTEQSWEEDQQSRVNKKSKAGNEQGISNRDTADQGAQSMAEEAGLMMPPTQP